VITAAAAKFNRELAVSGYSYLIVGAVVPMAYVRDKPAPGSRLFTHRHTTDTRGKFSFS